jgi:hypothetical protein
MGNYILYTSPTLRRQETEFLGRRIEPRLYDHTNHNSLSQKCPKTVATEIGTYRVNNNLIVH